MNAQEAARILAKENDSVVVVGIRREATGDLISDECFLNLDEFHAAVVCANLVGYILKIQKWLEKHSLKPDFYESISSVQAHGIDDYFKKK